MHGSWWALYAYGNDAKIPAEHYCRTTGIHEICQVGGKGGYRWVRLHIEKLFAGLSIDPRDEAFIYYI